MLEDIKANFENLDKTQQLRAKQLGVGLIIMLIFYIAWGSQSEEIVKTTIEQDKKQTSSVQITDGEIFEDDMTDELNKLKAELKETQKANQDLKKMFEFAAMSNTNDIADNSDIEMLSNSENASFPPPPARGSPIQSFQDSGDQSPINMQPQWIGGIVHESYEKLITSKATTDIENQKKRVFKLTPSFMTGFLLTGMDAMTIEGANDTPEPMMIRVQAPAVLPNEVKANLKGCFVVAEGYGNLATHRVDAKLVSLSCIDIAGKSVIFEKIKGYVQDGDGKRGIKGQPIHRAGSLLARSVLAGVFEGIGGALTNAAQTTSVSSLGQVNTTPRDNLSDAALGGGISSGAKDIRSLFLQLAKQSSPVIEVGAAKRLSVVITELVELKLQDL
ncbi:IncF plasmid conjugative transfer pilus assembly protein TraB [uncultured Candidatus Thioglobus sp.]|nr:IncF plasmid conjugative transfer pilus assembly protein TraB [uncultured Candidatus Thioglobus sp.]